MTFPTPCNPVPGMDLSHSLQQPFRFVVSRQEPGDKIQLTVIDSLVMPMIRLNSQFNIAAQMISVVVKGAG